MQPIIILADSRRFGQCPAGGAPIEWATIGKSGRRCLSMPPSCFCLASRRIYKPSTSKPCAP
jgi:hypothetical protein